MSQVTAEAVRSVLLAQLAGPLSAKQVQPEDVPDSFDLLTEGVLDSMGVLEVINAIEKHFQIQIDFENLDPENLTIVGPFCKYIESRCSVTDARQPAIPSNTDGGNSPAFFHVAVGKLGR